MESWRPEVRVEACDDAGRAVNMCILLEEKNGREHKARPAERQKSFPTKQTSEGRRSAATHGRAFPGPTSLLPNTRCETSCSVESPSWTAEAGVAYGLQSESRTWPVVQRPSVPRWSVCSGGLSAAVRTLPLTTYQPAAEHRVLPIELWKRTTDRQTGLCQAIKARCIPEQPVVFPK